MLKIIQYVTLLSVLLTSYVVLANNKEESKVPPIHIYYTNPDLVDPTLPAYITLISNYDNVIINNVIINEGNCVINPNSKISFPLTMKYGDFINIGYVYKNSEKPCFEEHLIVATNKGNFVDILK